MQRRVLRAIAVTIAIAAVVQILLPLLPDAPGTVLAGIVIAGAAFTAAVGNFRQARAARDRHRLGRIAALFGCVMLGLAYLVYAGSMLAGIPPGRSLGGPLSILAVVGAVGSVLLLAPRLPNKMAWLTHVLDVTIVGASMFTIGWRFVIVPVSSAMTLDAQQLFVLTMVPEVAAAALALILVSRTEPGQTGFALHLLAGALGSFAVAAVITTYNATRQLPWFASGAAFATVMASLLLVLASRATLSPADARGWRTYSGVWASLPYVPVLAALATVTVIYVRTGTLVPVLVWTLLGTSALAMVRQFLSLMTVRSLLHRLDKQRELLHHQAHHDPLTGLPNRAEFHARAAAALAAVAPSTLTALLLLDLDRFKPVNDTHGHAAGDRVLTTVSERFATAVRPGDLVARLGGDEFGVVLTGLTDLQQVDDIAARLVSLASKPVSIGAQQVGVGASVGIAMAERPGHTVEPLPKIADDALYAAKAAGRNRAVRAACERIPTPADR